MKPFTISRVQEAPQVPEEAGLTGWWRCRSAEYLIGTKRKKKKSAWTFQDTKHCLCWFQSWVTSRGPSVRKTIVEQQQRVKIGAGQERKPNQSRPVSHQRNPGHLTSTPTPSHQSTGCHPQVCKPLFLLPMRLHERISGCSTNSNNQYSSRCWPRNGSPIFLFALMLCQW